MLKINQKHIEFCFKKCVSYDQSADNSKFATWFMKVNLTENITVRLQTNNILI